MRARAPWTEADPFLLIVARGVKFNPAKNRGNPVAVWVTWMISYDP